MPEAGQPQIEILKTILDEFRHIGEAISALGERQARTETTLESLDSRLERYDALDTKMEKIESRLLIVETERTSETRSENKWQDKQRFTYGHFIAAGLALLGVIAAYAIAHIRWH